MDKFSPDTTLALMQTQQAATSKSASKVKAAGNIDIEKIDKTAQEFEAVFIAEMLKPMFAEIKHDGLFGGGKGEEIFHGIMVQEYGKMLSQTGGLGIADEVKATMIRMQQEANGLDPIEIAEIEQQIDNPNAFNNGEQDATSNE